MAFDLITMRGIVRTRLGVPTTDNFYTDAVLTQTINEAYYHVEAEEDWPWDLTKETLTTVAGTQTVTPGASWYQTKTLIVTNPTTSATLHEIPIRELDALNNAGQRNIPEAYAIADGLIYLAPIPAGVYTIQHRFYSAAGALLSGDTDVPIVPTQFRHTIVAFAVYLCLMRANETVRATNALAEYTDWTRIMKDAKNSSTEPSRTFIRPGGWV